MWGDWAAQRDLHDSVDLPGECRHQGEDRTAQSGGGRQGDIPDISMVQSLWEFLTLI